MKEDIHKPSNEGLIEQFGQNSKVFKVGEKFILTNEKPKDGVEITQEIAQKISERLDFALDYSDAKKDTLLGEELAHSNCYGSVSMVFDLSNAGKSTLSFENGEVVELIPYKEYQTYDDLKIFIQNLQETPLILSVGPHRSHTLAFMGFNESGDGVVFQKGNASSNYPWEVMSLKEVFQEYCVDDYYKRITGITVYKPNSK